MSVESTDRGGLDGVVVAETKLSDVDGERGRLILAGHNVEQLAGSIGFEDAVALFQMGRLPSPLERDRVAARLGRWRLAAWKRLPELGAALAAEDGMDALRAAVAHLATDSVETGERPAMLIAAMAVFAAAWWRTRIRLGPVSPDASLSHAADYLRMLSGTTPAAHFTAGLDAYLVTVADHGMNASTFTARVIASTASDIVSAVTGALGALKGPLHGGAPGPVLDMLDAVGEPQNAVAWLEAELAAGRRIMGMGHRVYRVRDPRAAVLERAVDRLEQAGVQGGRLALARAIEEAALGVLRVRHPDRPLHANVEFFTALLLDALGLDRCLFTPTFACSRIVGWCAHFAEQQRTGRLIRPSSRYIGPVPPPH